jgi:hypothetical protein
VIQAIYDRNQLGIRFLDVSPRKRDQLVEMIQELGAAEAQIDAQADASLDTETDTEIGAQEERSA